MSAEVTLSSWVQGRQGHFNVNVTHHSLLHMIFTWTFSRPIYVVRFCRTERKLFIYIKSKRKEKRKRHQMKTKAREGGGDGLKIELMFLRLVHLTRDISSNKHG